MRLRPPLFSFLCIASATAVTPDLVLARDDVGYGEHLSEGQSLVPASSASASIAPIWATPPVTVCTDEGQACFIGLSSAGELAVYAHQPQPHAVSILRAGGTVDAAGNDGESYALGISAGGDVVLTATSIAGETTELWSAGSAFPADCDAACIAGSVLVARKDGSLALRRGVSAAMQAYLNVGVQAAARLRSCLWHTGFAATAVLRTEPLAAPLGVLVGDGECRAPPSMMLLTFPNSGTSFTLQATLSVTNHSVYTVYQREGPALDEDALKTQSECSLKACRQLDTCIVNGSAPGQFSIPPPGKGALVKCHGEGYGNTFGCHNDKCLGRFMDTITASGKREPYGFLRLHRNPFDNLVARFHFLLATGRLKDVPFTREGFLREGGLGPMRDIYAYLNWNINTNMALRSLNKPTGLLTYEDIYLNGAKYLRAVVAMLGWTADEIPDSVLEAESQRIMGRNVTLTEDSEMVPTYIDRFYDADTIECLAEAINEELDRTGCLEVPAYFKPGKSELNIYTDTSLQHSINVWEGTGGRQMTA